MLLVRSFRRFTEISPILRVLHVRKYSEKPSNSWITDITHKANSYISRNFFIKEERKQPPTSLSLCEAVVKGDYCLVSLLLSSGANSLSRDSSGNTPLHLSILHNYPSISRLLLLHNNSSIHSPTNFGSKGLHLAAREGKIELVKILLEFGANTNDIDSDRSTPFVSSCYSGKIEIVRELLQFHPPLCDIVKGLKIAVNNGNLDIIKEILDTTGVDVNSEGMILLVDAAKHGRLDVVNFLLSRNSQINCCDEKGRTPLHMAINFNNTEVALTLIDNGANLNNDIFLCAARNGNVEVIRKLKNTGAIENRDNASYAFYIAIAHDQFEAAKELIDNVSDLDERDSFALFYSSSKGNVEMIKILAHKGANVNRESTSFCCEQVFFGKHKNSTFDIGGKISPLFVAVYHNKLEATKELIRLGATVDKENEFGVTPLFYAIAHENIEMIKVLVNNGANVNKISTQSTSPLSTAIQYSNWEIVQTLLTLGASANNLDLLKYLLLTNQDDVVSGSLAHFGLSVDSRDSNGDTPLHWAIRNNKIFLAKELVRLGANVNAGNNKGYTPLIYAVAFGSYDILKSLDLLISHGAKVNEKSGGITPLFVAIIKKHWMSGSEAVRKLLESGADPNQAADEVTGLDSDLGIELLDTKIEQTLLLNAAKINEESALYLIQAGANVNVVTCKGGYSALHLAAASLFKDLVKEMVDRGASLDAKTEDGKTALHLLEGVACDSYLENTKQEIKKLLS